MRISTFFYTIKQGIVNIWKNKLFSLVSIATMTACIFLFGLFYMIVVNFQSMVKDAESGVAVTVLFDEGISDQRIEEIGELISERPEVSHYDFISADEAWESFKEVYFEGNEAAAASFAGDNPLANSASYAIYMNDISMEEIANYTGRSLSTFKRDFKKCSTLSPREWLIRRRLEAARELIRKGGRKVSDICFEVGFKNLSHFSKIYKETYGIPPTEDTQPGISLA